MSSSSSSFNCFFDLVFAILWPHRLIAGIFFSFMQREVHTKAGVEYGGGGGGGGGGSSTYGHEDKQMERLEGKH